MSDESIFAVVLGIADPAQRAEYLNRACEGDSQLRGEVEKLLAAHGASNPLDRRLADFETTGVNTGKSDDLPSAEVGDKIGRYRLLERIGEGGFSSVFVAEQVEPVRRKVAIKVLKPGMDSREVIARFQAERQALALMDHPNIAMVFDAGSTPQGRPYIAMELVLGIPITDYCDKHKLPTQ